MKKYISTTALVFNKQSVAARVYFINLFADQSPCVRDPNDPANYTVKTLSDDQKLEQQPEGVSNYHGWRSGHGCVTALEMTQLTVSIVYVFPTILFQMKRHLSQKASKTGRKQVMSALTPMRAVKNTNFQIKR